MKRRVLVFMLLAGISMGINASMRIQPNCSISKKECLVNGYKAGGSIPVDLELENLRDIVQMINENPDIVRIELTGYTDTEEIMSDKELSYMRAANVYEYMKIYGLNENIKVEFSGEGKNKPLETNDTAEGRYTNRRVHIIFFVKGN